MTKEIKHSTPREQIELLKQKGLLFDDEESALKKIMTYGYYNIINSYKESYLINDNQLKQFKEGVTFEQIFSLFTLDHSLRNSIMASMQDLEEHLRAITAEVISESFGVNHKEYLNPRNYRDRKASLYRFSLAGILETLNKNALSDKNPIKYYREKYGYVPPWILLKGTYFSTLVNFIRLLKHKEKCMLISRLYGITDYSQITPSVIELLTTTLFICLEYRNMSAHGGRIYNFYSNHSDTLKVSDEICSLQIISPAIRYRRGISQLLILMDVFQYNQPGEIIKKSLQSEINRHLYLYPQDIDILQEAANIDIEYVRGFWVNGKSKIFHCSPECCGLSKAHLVEVDELECNGYRPCLRCASQFYVENTKENMDSVSK